MRGRLFRTPPDTFALTGKDLTGAALCVAAVEDKAALACVRLQSPPPLAGSSLHFRFLAPGPSPSLAWQKGEVILISNNSKKNLHIVKNIYV